MISKLTFVEMLSDAKSKEVNSNSDDNSTHSSSPMTLSLEQGEAGLYYCKVCNYSCKCI